MELSLDIALRNIWKVLTVRIETYTTVTCDAIITTAVEHGCAHQPELCV